MDTKNGFTRDRAGEWNALEAAQLTAMEREERRRRTIYGAWMSVTAIAAVITVAVVGGCGHEKSARTASLASEPSAASQAVVASTEGGERLSTGTPTERPEEFSSDLRALPPDLVPAVSDTFVTAGQAVEVKVEGTPDVTEMALSDGRGDALPMVRDSVGNVWRVGYRVPLRPQQERIALSVTAKNDQHRWRRVWLFIQVDDGQHPIESQSASPDTNR